MSNHNLESIFNNHNWDIEEPSAGHEKRFKEKLNAFKPKKRKTIGQQLVLLLPSY
jgi:hypothetical protein